MRIAPSLNLLSTVDAKAANGQEFVHDFSLNPRVLMIPAGQRQTDCQKRCVQVNLNDLDSVG